MSLWSDIRKLSTLEIGGDEGVRLWVIKSRSSDDLADYAAFLLPDEQRRAERFKLEIHRQRFTIARSALRHILGKELACLPEDIQLDYGEAGKPEIRLPATTLKFSVSHSGPITLIALSDLVPVGIDVEYPDGDIDLLSVGRTVFCPLELSRLEECVDIERTKLFYKLWTAKEAVLKVLGTGFLSPQYEFCIIDELLDGKPIKTPATYMTTGAPEWIQVQHIDIGNSYYAALATGANL